MSEPSSPSKTFLGVRFVLFGFDPISQRKVRTKLVSGGGVDAGQYSENCTHVIVDKNVYDDPVCAAARNDGKTLVTGLWVDHSFDIGMPVDASSIMYRPRKDMTGIPGAANLIICLTGYQRQDREDIMTMVGLMGAQFSKPLVANKITHLICYKFEGEKYELARKLKKIKLVNHRWLEDCLRDWELLPEDNYNKSGYELEMMEAEAKDSEEEVEDTTEKQYEEKGMNKSLHNSKVGISSAFELPQSSREVSVIQPNSTPQKDLVGVVSNNDVLLTPGKENTSPQASSFGRVRVAAMHDYLELGPSKEASVVLPEAHDRTLNSEKVYSHLLPNCRSAESPSDSGTKLNSISSRKTPRRSIPSVSSRGMPGKLRSSPEANISEIVGAVEISSPIVEHTNERSGSDSVLLTPGKESRSHQASCFDRVQVAEPHDCLELGALKEASVILPETHDRTPNSTKVYNHLASNCRSAEHPSASVTKLNSISVRRSPRKSLLAVSSREVPGMFRGSPEPNKAELAGAVDISPSRAVDANKRRGSDSAEIPRSGSESCNKKELNSMLSQKREEDTSYSSSKYQKVGRDAKLLLTGSPNRKLVLEATPSQDAPLKTDDHLYLNKDGHSVDESALVNAAQFVSTAKTLRRYKKSAAHNSHFSKTALPETWPDDNVLEKPPQTSPERLEEPISASKPDAGVLDAGDSAHVVEPEEPQNQKQHVKVSSPSHRKSEIENYNAPAHSNSLQDKNESVAKPLRKKTLAKKTLGSRPKLSKTTNQKGPIFSNKAASLDPTNCLTGEHDTEEGKFSCAYQTVTESAEAKQEVGKNIVMKCDGGSLKNVEAVDDETEPPDDKDELEFEKALSDEMFEVTHSTGAETRTNSALQQVTDMAKAARHDELVPEEGILRVETEKAVCNEKIEVSELVSNEDVKKKVTKGKKRTSPKAKKKASTIVTERRSSENVKNTEEKEMKKQKNTSNTAGKTVDSCVSAHKLEKAVEVEKENVPGVDRDQNLKLREQHIEKSGKSKKVATDMGDKSGKISSNSTPLKEISKRLNSEPAWFILSGHRLQRKEFQQVIKRLKGRCCRDAHQWSYQATHFLAPDPIRRTEKFFAAAASGRWILKTDYLSACNQAGKFLGEEPFEWHKCGLSEDGAINLEAPRKWRLLRETTGHGAFYGVRIVVYGECIVPPLDTLKRVVKAGDGTILATSPPYTRFLKSGVDFAIVSPGMPRADMWVQEFINHEIPCIVADYLVEYVCKPGFSLEKHVLYNTHAWAERSFSRLQSKAEEVVQDLSTQEDHDSDDMSCQVCGSRDRAEVMLICGDESCSAGCGVGMHIDCCDPPLENVPEEDWFCPKCQATIKPSNPSKRRKKGTSVRFSTIDQLQ